MALYRLASGDTAFSAIDPSEYNITVEDLIVDGYTYEMTFVDFLANQNGARITANIKGLYFRPALGTIPAQGYDPLLNPSGIPGELHNPIDAFLNLMRLDCRKALSFDDDGLSDLHDYFTAVDLVSGGTAAYDCSGAITESETRRAILTKLLPDFMLDMFHNRAGEITLSFTKDNEDDKPLFSDRRIDGARNLILRESFFENDPSPIANRCSLPALRHYAANTWLWTGQYENFYDQAIAGIPQRDESDVIITDGGEPVRDPRIEPIDVEFWFSRDSTTIYDVISRRMAFMTLKSYQQEFDLPTPEVIDDVELCKLLRLTHQAGLAAGGYSQVEVKIFGISFDLRGFKTTLNTVRRVPDVVLGTTVVVYGAASIDAESELDITPPEYEFIVSTSGASADTHVATTPEVDTTNADLLVAAVADYQFSDGSIVMDNYGNTWHHGPPTLYQDGDSLLEQVQIWYCIPAAVGPHHVFVATEAVGGVVSQPSIAVAAFRYAKSSSPFDVENGNSHDSPPLIDIQPGSITPSEDRELIVTALATDTSVPDVSINSGFTLIENQLQIPTAYGIALAFKIQTTAAAVNPTWDSGLGSGPGMSAAIASFKAN